MRVCVKTFVYVKTFVCKFVDHLKRCKTSLSYFCWMLFDYGFIDVESEFFSRGHAAITQTHANEAMCDGGSRD